MKLSWRHGALGGWSLVAAALSVSLSAAADEAKMQCISANTRAQDLRRENKLALAREQLHLCVDAKCPSVVRSDCTKLLEELENAQPTIVFDAKNGAGADISAVKVTIDGQLFADKLDGSALRVDPGDHTFVFSSPGEALVAAHYVIKEGEKGRHERVTIGTPAAVAAAAAPPRSPPPVVATTPPPHEGRGGSRLRASRWGIGLAGIVVGGVFGGLTASAIHEQSTDCSGPTRGACPNYSGAASAHSTANTDGAVSTIGFIAGGALLATGVVMYLLPGAWLPRERGARRDGSSRRRPGHRRWRSLVAGGASDETGEALCPRSSSSRRCSPLEDARCSWVSKTSPPFDPALGGRRFARRGRGTGRGGRRRADATVADGGADVQGPTPRPDATLPGDAGLDATVAADAAEDATPPSDDAPSGGDAGPCVYSYSYDPTINGCEVRCDALNVYVIIQTGSSGGFCSFAGPATSCFGCYSTAPDGAISDLWYESPGASCSANNVRAIGALCGW